MWPESEKVGRHISSRCSGSRGSVSGSSRGGGGGRHPLDTPLPSHMLEYSILLCQYRIDITLSLVYGIPAHSVNHL